MNVESKKNFIISIAFLLICFGLVYLAISYVLPWLFPFIIALIMAAVLNGPIVWISQKIRLGRGFVAVFLVLLIFLILGLFLWLVGYQVVNSAVDILNQLVEFSKQVLPLVAQRLANYIYELPPDAAEDLVTATRSLTEMLQNGLISIATNSANTLVGFTTSGLPSILVGFIITVVACCYVSRDYVAVKNFLKRLIPSKYRENVVQIQGYLVTTGLTLLRSYALLMLLTFVELLVFLSLYKIKNAIAIAGIIAVIDVLPVLGTGTILIPWALISFILGNVALGIKIICAYLVVTGIRNMVEPKLIGAQIGINPIFTLIAMYVGLQLFGVAGMFLMVFLVILLKKLYDAGQFHLGDEDP